MATTGKKRTGKAKVENVAVRNKAKALATADAEKKLNETKASFSVSTYFAGATTTAAFMEGALGKLDLEQTADVIIKSGEVVNKNDLTGLEARLATQVVTLDVMFNELARRAALNMGTHIDATERYLRLALKAQGQCRATLETLAEIKNPHPVHFVRQANIAHGPQQVNNATGSGKPACAGELTNQSNELLGVNIGERLDTRTQGATGSAYQGVETVGAFDGATN